MPSDLDRNKEEEKYFQAKETERREAVRLKLEKAAGEAREQREMAESLQTDDEALVQRLRDMHFDKDTVRVLDVLPLVHVAWADGSVTTRQRAAVLDVLRERGIEGHSEAFLLIESLLEKRPTDTFLEETLELLHDLLGDSSRTNDVVDLCVRVADASGGFFGLGDRISDKERALMERIVDRLGDQARDAFVKRLASR
ncbi:MAG: TerB family tellurite resistance protein [Deltaproteobacteria bacterium]|nr:MAG: TerB family tellurite resistance protein [Deltaproteobacteria bacterium]